MSSSNQDAQWTTETPLPPRKRAASYASVPNFSSAKRRRTSMLVDLELQPDSKVGSTSNFSPVAHALDRFIPSRPKSAIPLNATPRTNRISRQFGLTDDRVFNFKNKENQETIPFGNRDEMNMVSLLRRSASSLFHIPPRPRLTSVTENLGKCKQCTLTLDGPGITDDQYACPITWSRHNMIAVACGNDIFYQDLETRSVSHLCKLQVSNAGRLHAIEWAGKGRESVFASGSTTGVVQVWDAGRGGPGKFMRMWRDDKCTGVGGLGWSEDLLAVGSYDGTISLFDVRKKTDARRMSAHKGKVLGIKWSADGSLVASGDDLGIVYVWDKRAGKELLDEGTHGSKMRHRGPVKALAWCPWKPDLLATGSIFPEGKIRVWSSSSCTTSSPSPLLTLPLNTSVLSLHWSPHCKELLSTHGPSFQPPSLPKPPSSTRLSTLGSMSTPQPSQPPPLRPTLKPTPSPLTNAIAVHEYPSGKRLLHLTMAHFGPVTHSCISPDGQNMFTVCPKEETIKMWQVWGKREGVERESAFDKCTIR